jgi:hypothetical protein
LYFDSPVDKNITLTLDMKGMMAGHMKGMGDMHDESSESTSTHGGIEWEVDEGMMQMMNNMSNKNNVEWKIQDTETQKSNMDVDWVFKK